MDFFSKVLDFFLILKHAGQSFALWFGGFIHQDFQVPESDLDNHQFFSCLF
jgi:hypothetical protein